MPRVVHVRESVPGAVFIGRPGPYGNPYIIGLHGDRQDVIDKYVYWLAHQPDLVEKIKDELRGRDLACFCRPPWGFKGRVMCHGQVLAAVANGGKPTDYAHD